jgi:putative transcriptional regulator
MTFYLLFFLTFAHYDFSFIFSYFAIVKKDDLNKKIGQRIIQLREKKGLTQSDLARACNKERQAVEKLENGRVNPTLYSLYEVAKALQVPLTSLVDFKI